MKELKEQFRKHTVRPFATSKHVVFVCSLNAGSNWPSELRRNGWRYFVGGNVHITYPDGTTTNLVPKTLIKDNAAKPKYLAHKPLEAIVLEDSEWVCYSDIENKEVVYPEFVDFKAGDSFTLSANTDLFLIKGTVSIDGKEYQGPYNIRVRNKDCRCVIMTDCYTLNFK